ncbi:MAG: hypothetical protein VKI83_09930 [Synechococcaceae cyanobacterium]|nr:hypothetical protein [Synechococcaceae cyanobacterium]
MTRSAPGSGSSGLQLPRPRKRPQRARSLFRGRAPQRRPHRSPLQTLQLLAGGVALLALGGGLALLVATLPQWTKALPLLSVAAGHLLNGLVSLGLGLVQLGGLLAVLLLSLLAALLMLAGAIRLFRAVLPPRSRPKRLDPRPRRP